MTDILIAVFVCLCVILVWVTLYDSNRFVIRRYTAADERIKRKVRAVVLADLHNKSYGKKNERLLAAIREQEPDFVLVAGDIPTAVPGMSLEPALDFLRELAKDYPIYYGNGNHEHRLKLYPKTYQDMAERYGQALKEMGIEPLVNSHSVLKELGIAIYGLELDKLYYKRFHIRDMPPEYMEETLGKRDEAFYTVLLAHNPDYFPKYAAWGADLVLSGHVHGGVARVPFWGKGLISPSMRLFPKYDGGIFHEDKSAMVLSRGLGMHTIHIRIFNPAELWVVEFGPE